jgi:hypothetical protein
LNVYKNGLLVSNRDYLLQAWYKHTFTFGENHTLGLVGGIIDATDYLDGAEQTEESLTDSQVVEAYVRFGLNDYLALTFDLQYMQDNYTASDSDVDGWIAGVRATCEF